MARMLRDLLAAVFLLSFAAIAAWKYSNVRALELVEVAGWAAGATICASLPLYLVLKRVVARQRAEADERAKRVEEKKRAECHSIFGPRWLEIARMMSEAKPRHFLEIRQSCQVKRY